MSLYFSTSLETTKRLTKRQRLKVVENERCQRKESLAKKMSIKESTEEENKDTFAWV